MKRKHYLLSLLILSILLTGCGQTEVAEDVKQDETPPLSTEKKERDNVPEVLEPKADGAVVYENRNASIDASHAEDGYVCVAYRGDASKVRMLIETPVGNTYNYLMDLDGQYDVYPLSEGDGSYKIGVYENLHDDQYALAFSQTVKVVQKDEFSAFLYPNAYVNFNADSEAVAKAARLAQGAEDDLTVVNAVYHYIAENVSYDYDKAKTVQSGYVPDVDETLATGKGICFDYASLMGAMLRSQKIPTRLEIGYAGTEYHAWVSVYTEETGWIDGIIQFDGHDWCLMDPTLASYAKKSTVRDHWESDTYYQLKYKY